MTAQTKAVASRAGGRSAWVPLLLRSLPLKIAVVFICLLWSVPTMGLFVSSLRPAQKITQTGWWEAILAPFQAGQWTLANYQQVLGSEGTVTIRLLMNALPMPSLAMTVE